MQNSDIVDCSEFLYRLNLNVLSFNSSKAQTFFVPMFTSNFNCNCLVCSLQRTCLVINYNFFYNIRLYLKICIFMTFN